MLLGFVIVRNIIFICFEYNMVIYIMFERYYDIWKEFTTWSIFIKFYKLLVEKIVHLYHITKL